MQAFGQFVRDLSRVQRRIIHSNTKEVGMVSKSILGEIVPKVSSLFDIDTDKDDIESALEELREEEEQLEERLQKVKRAITRLEGWLEDLY